MTTAEGVNFGAILRRARLAVGLTQEELAEQAHLSVRAIASLEQGTRRNPHRHTLQVLADALGLTDTDRRHFEAAGRSYREVAVRPNTEMHLEPAPTVRMTDVRGYTAVTHERDDEARISPLPPQLTPFVGRQREVEEVTRLLRRPHVRLLTLTGPGGTGKTRLALQVAREALHVFPDGLAFVPLASLTDAGLLTSTIATTLKVKEVNAEPILESLAAQLRTKRLLLVLDTFEHLLPAADAVSQLLTACPQLTVLVTSRAALHLAAEHEYPVPPLPVPTPMHPLPVEALSRYEAVQLFVQRVQAVKPDFQLAESNASAVAEICRRLEGLPLGIELAAARVKVLPPPALLARLERPLQILTGGPRDLPARQQTMRNAIAWSYDLLDGTEQTLVRRLAVFTGSFTVEAAEPICHAPGRLDLDFLHGLSSLVDKSLLRVQEHDPVAGDPEPRFVMLDTIREYGLEQLAQSGEDESARRAHASWYLALAEEAEPELRGAEQRYWLGRLESDYANLRAALSWAQESEEGALGLRVAIALSRFWRIRGHLTEGQRWLTTLLDSDAELTSQQRATALLKLGELVFAEGRERDAAELFDRSLALYREQGDQQGSSEALGRLADTLHHLGEDARAVALLNEMVTLGRERGDQALLATALCRLAIRSAQREDAGQARRLGEECLVLYRELDDIRGTMNALEIVALAAYREGDLVHARAVTEEMIALLPQSGLDQEVAARSEDLAWPARDQGDYGSALRWLEALEARARELGDRRYAAHVHLVRAILAREQGEYAGAQTLLEESLVMFQETQDLRGIGSALLGLSDIARDLGEPEGVLAPGQAALDLFRQTGSAFYTGLVLHNLGLAAGYQGDYARAEILLAKSLSALQQSAASTAIAEVLTAVGLVELEQGQHDQAQQALVESLVTATTWTLGTVLEGLAGVASGEGHLERAARLFGAAAAIRTRFRPANQALYQRHVTHTRDALGEEGWTRLREEGQAMTRDEAVTYALQDEGD